MLSDPTTEGPLSTQTVVGESQQQATSHPSGVTVTVHTSPVALPPFSETMAQSVALHAQDQAGVSRGGHVTAVINLPAITSAVPLTPDTSSSTCGDIYIYTYIYIYIYIYIYLYI